MYNAFALDTLFLHTNTYFYCLKKTNISPEALLKRINDFQIHTLVFFVELLCCVVCLNYFCLYIMCMELFFCNFILFYFDAIFSTFKINIMQSTMIGTVWFTMVLLD